MSALDLDAIEALAKLAREETFRPGWPYGGSGEWTDNVIGMLGGATGNFAGAMSPDVVDTLIAALRERDNTITRVREVLDDYDGLTREVIPKLSTHAWMHEVRAALDPQEPETCRHLTTMGDGTNSHCMACGADTSSEETDD